MKRLGLLLALLAPCTAFADELELYRGEPVNVPSRIMLLIDTSDSMQGLLVREAADGTVVVDQEGNELVPLNDATSNETVLMDGFQRYYRGNCYEGDEAANRFGSVQSHANRKICRLKKVIKELLNQWPDNTEVGLARYAEPGAVIEAPLIRLGQVYSLVPGGDSLSHRDQLVRRINALVLGSTIVDDAIVDFGGYTPLAGSYVEVAQYLTGGQPVSEFSRSYSMHQWYVGETEHSIWENPTTKSVYKAPTIGAICDTFNTHLVVLTDGLSTNEFMGVSNSIGAPLYHNNSHQIHFHGTTTLGQKIGTLSGGSLDQLGYSTGCASDVQSPNIWSCANLVARRLANYSTEVDGESVPQFIKTSTIAFSLSAFNDVMAAWAEEGSGSFYSANNEDELRRAFGDVGLTAISDGTFTATVPGVSVNQTNRFSHADELYYSVFDPSSRPFWYGNLKKYRLAFTGPEADRELVVVGSDGERADSDQDGFFDEDVRSYWSDLDDGDQVHQGGAAAEIGTYSSRNLFVDLGSYSADKPLVNIRNNVDGQNLTDFVTEIRVNYLAEDLAANPEDGNRSALSRKVDWLRGQDVADEWNALTGVDRGNRTLYGAPIHSSPVLVNYTSTSSAQPLSLEDQDNLVFISTNDGKLYAVDAEDGSERFAFIPQALTHRTGADTPSFLDQSYAAATSSNSGSFLYGLDSTWTSWRQDVNGDGNITTGASADFVYLFGGMRRGGRNYYSLDVTDALSSSPSIDQRFVLRGGEAGTAFANMGQTWSEPTLALTKFNGQSQVVMLVGGGYDPLYDDVDVLANGSDPKGAQLFAIQAHGGNAGDVVWWASDTSVAGVSPAAVISSALEHSIPSTVKVLDRDRDGFVDHIYVGDMGGQVHRFDLVHTDTLDGEGNVTSTATSVVHNLVAQLGHGGETTRNATNNRRFFFPPSVALMRDASGPYVGIAIGSGLITSPKDTEADERFYFIKDREPFGVTQDLFAHSTGLGKTEVADLTLVALNGSPPVDANTTAAPAVSVGLDLDAEKFLGSPLILEGRVFFTTYYSVEAVASGPQCSAASGKAALYEYVPGQNYITQRRIDLPQSAAGTISLVLLNDPQADGDGSTEILGLPGGPTSAIPLGDLPNTVRKTRWFRCPDPTDAACGG